MTPAFDERDRANVIRDLSSSDEDVRRLAVERADGLAPGAALPLLIERLGDTSWRVRKVAVERLVARADDQSLAAALIGALADGDNPGRRNGAVEALVLCGERVVPTLLAACESQDSDVRKLVVDALAGIGDVAANDTLVGMLDDLDPNVRAAAADALGALGNPAAASQLLERAGRAAEDPLVRLSALRALGSLAVPVRASELASVLDDSILRPAALDLLGSEDAPEAVVVMQKALASPSRSTREAAMRAVLRLLSNVDGGRSEALRDQVAEAAAGSPELLEDALERLGESDLPTTLMLVQFLGLVRSEPAVVPLLRSARDEAVAEVALATLESFGVQVEALIESAWGDLDTAARRDACHLFGRTHGERGALLLASALESSDCELRMAAARGVGKRAALAALPLVVRRLELVATEDEIEADDERSALVEAIVALATVGEEARSRVDALLRERVGDATESVRVALAGALAQVAHTDDASFFLLLLKDPSAEVRRVAVEALGRMDSAALAAEPLRLALADEDAGVRIAAAACLSRGEGAEALRDLRGLSEDPDPRVRAVAVRGVGRRLVEGGAPAELHAALTSALEDDALVALAAIESLQEVGGELSHAAAAVLERPEPELVREAVRCLGAAGEESVLAGLLPLVSHPDWSVRAEAIGVLAERRFVRAAPAILGLLGSERDEFVRAAILQALERLEG